MKTTKQGKMQGFESLRVKYVGILGNLSMQVDRCVVYVEQTVSCVNLARILLLPSPILFIGIGQR
jgi:hypothetical protein